MRALRPLFVLPLLAVTTGCLETLTARPERVAFLYAVAHDNGGVPALRVNGVVYEAPNLNVSIGNPGTCQIGIYSSTPTGSNAPTLDAGPSFTAMVSGNSASLARIVAGRFTRYDMTAGTSIAYTPGDTLRIDIPGGASGGFPASFIRVRTAEAFTHDPVPVPETTAPLDLAWSAATVPGSVMTIALRYSTVEGSTLPNAEIYCVFADDGTGSVPTSYAALWAASAVASRSYEFTRVRESSVLIAERTRARAFSFYAVPTPTIGGT
jgi:hypothetical protein